MDMTLAGDEIIRAHRLILAACSPYFNSLFSHGWDSTGGGAGGTIRVSGVRYQVQFFLIMDRKRIFTVAVEKIILSFFHH